MEKSQSILCELEAAGSRKPPFFFFSLRLGTLVVVRRICLVYWEPCVPAGTTGTIWNPYKSEGSCVCFVCEMEKGGEEEGV